MGEWQPCGSSYFTKHELYQMAWGEQDLSTKRRALWPLSPLLCTIETTQSRCRVAGSRDAGPLATVRDERKIVRVTGGVTQPVIQIFSCAGSPLGAFVWDAGRLAAFAWTGSQRLLTLDAQGQASVLTRSSSLTSSGG